MNIRNNLGTLGAVVVMATGALSFGVPALASSDVGSRAGCSGNVTCVFDGGVNQGSGSYTGLLGTRSPGTGLADISSGNRNKLSSWINHTGTGARFYYGTGGNGTCVSMGANNQASASSSNPDNNQAESHAYTRTC